MVTQNDHKKEERMEYGSKYLGWKDSCSTKDR